MAEAIADTSPLIFLSKIEVTEPARRSLRRGVDT